MSNASVQKHPLAEVFGFPPAASDTSAKRHRTKRLCPFNNKVPNCTKDKAQDPLGVCSVVHGNSIAYKTRLKSAAGALGGVVV